MFEFLITLRDNIYDWKFGVIMLNVLTGVAAVVDEVFKDQHPTHQQMVWNLDGKNA